MTLHGAAAILYQEDEVLIVKHGEQSDHPTGLYSLPGGRTEPNEKDTKDTILREIKEETGLDLDKESLQFLNHYYFELGGKEGMRKVSVNLYTYEVSCEREGNYQPKREATPIWVKIKDYLSRKYPITYVSSNFLDDVDDFLRGIIVTFKQT